MDTAVLEQMLDETFDHAVMHHGYTNYMPTETWQVSLDDRPIESETGVDIDGYVWA